MTGARFSHQASDRFSSYEERCRQIVAAFRGGARAFEIAANLHILPSTVMGVLRDAGLLPGRRRRAAPAQAYEVPSWVPPQYVEHFHEIARRDGEEAAAASVRRLKRGAR